MTSESSRRREGVATAQPGCFSIDPLGFRLKTMFAVVIVRDILGRIALWFSRGSDVAKSTGYGHAKEPKIEAASKVRQKKHGRAVSSF